jgi:hypothetical protein
MGITNLLKAVSKGSSTASKLKKANKIQAFAMGMDSARNVDKAKKVGKTIKRLAAGTAAAGAAYYEGKTGNISKTAKKGINTAKKVINKVAGKPNSKPLILKSKKK